MNKVFAIPLVLVIANTCNATARLTLVANTDAEAVQMASDVIAMDAFQLRGSNGLSSILYSEPFPVTVWGESRPVPDAWENRNGVMQDLLRRDWPADWFNILPFSTGSIDLRHWTILDSPTLGKASSLDVWPFFGLDGPTKLKISDSGGLFMFKLIYDTPATYQVWYSNRVTVIVPEPAALVLLLPLMLLLVRRRR